MLTINDIIKLELTKEDVFSCINKTQQNNFIDNLRYRHINVQFDCKLRGYIGEIAINKWFTQYGIELEKTNYLNDGDNIDIDFLVKGKSVELKTSLTPDIDENLNNVILRRDIKLIKRGNETIEQLRGDIHMQIYYTQKRQKKDSWLKLQNININSDDHEYLFNAFLANRYMETTFFIAWIDKPSLIAHINSLPDNQKYWSFPNSQRLFWNCKLQISRKPLELISYINDL